MTAERWQQIKDALAGAMERGGEERAAFLAELETRDAELYREVTRYLAASPSESFLERPPAELAMMGPVSALAPGTKLGTYEVIAAIGRGGMGEVYRAHDTTLHREVALKILPEAFAEDPERLARFKREAQALAALNHPNIATIHGFEEVEAPASADDQPVDQRTIHFLVLELVEGPTLEDRIREGAIPVAESVTIARQIADALEAAHAAGIIHRDLKPANVKLREDDGRTVVKVLDFGLAKLAAPQSRSRSGSDPAALTASPTLTTPAQTMQGVILGTAAYMSPEQAKGKAVDTRADVWAFGVVFYEMLTGQRAFEGEDVSDTLAAILRGEPDWDRLPADLSPTLRLYLQRCLHKAPRQRVGDMQDLRLALEGAFDAVAQVEPELAPGRRAGSLAGAAALIALAAGTAAWVLKPSPVLEPAPASRTVVVTPPEAPHATQTAAPFSSLLPTVAISRNGEGLVYLSSGADGSGQLVYRRLDGLDVTPLRGTETGIVPAFSPDGLSVAFWHSGDAAIKRVSVLGGAAVPVMAPGDFGLAAPAVNGIAWAPDDTLLFAGGMDLAGLWAVSASGGEPEQLMPAAAGTLAAFPEVLPGGRILFLESPQQVADTDARRFKVFSPANGEVVDLMAGTGPARYASGHLVYGRDGTLWVVGFDPPRLELTTDPRPIANGVRYPTTGNSDFHVSASGRLVYVAEDNDPSIGVVPVWVDRSGREEALALPPGNYWSPALSPDGKQLAIEIVSNRSDGRPQADTDVWLADLTRPSAWQRLTSTPRRSGFPVWSVEGDRVFYANYTNFSPDPGLFVRPTDPSREAQRIEGGGARTNLWPADVTPDGRRLVIQEGNDVTVVAIEGDGPPVTLLGTDATEAAPQVADGGGLAYTSNQSGRFEVYVERFPDGGGRQRASTDGGTAPRWSRDGRELFYLRRLGAESVIDLEADVAVMRVAVSPGSSPTLGNPEELFRGPYRGTLMDNPQFGTYDVSLDGRRFLMLKREDTPSYLSGQIVLVQNWADTLAPVRSED